MHIENLHIDHFGNHSRRLVDGFSNRFNVVYAPDEETKQATIQFIRWMLFGNSDGTTQRYLHQATQTPSGSMTVVHDGHRRTVARRDDGTRYGRLAVDGGEHFSPQTNHMVSLLGNVSQSDFDCFFAPQLNAADHLEGLFESARVHGLDLETRTISSGRREPLRQRIEQLRGELDRLPGNAESPVGLRERRERLLRQVAELDTEQARRRTDLEDELRRCDAEVARLRNEIDQLRLRWRAKDDDVSHRRGRLEEAWRVAKQARSEFVGDLRSELSELDVLISRWRGMVAELQSRYDRISEASSKRRADIESDLVDDHGPSCPVASLAARLDRLRDQLAGRSDSADGYQRTAECHDMEGRTSGSLSNGLDELRAMVSDVCEQLRKQYPLQPYDALDVEMEQLQQCDSVLSRWIEHLDRQRQYIADELATADQQGVSLVVDEQTDASGRYVRFDGPAELPRRPVHAVLHDCDGYQPTDPDTDSLLRRLVEDRDALSREIDVPERRLREFLDRRGAIVNELAQLGELRLEPLRQEIGQVECRMRDAERHEQLERELRTMEDELRSLPDEVRIAATVEHASDLLQRLTSGRYTRLRIDERNEVWVEDAATVPVPLRELDAQSRDDVHLCLCLALVAACRRVGIEMPLVLDDVLSGVDATHDEALVSVLGHFTSAGHQLVLFTRHRHVPELFANVDFRLISLEPQVRVEPTAVEAGQLPVAEAADRIRFKRRTVDDHDWRRRDRATRNELADQESTHEVETVESTTSPVAEPARRIMWDTSIDATGVIDADVAARLRAIGVVEVREFLELTVDEIDRELHAWGITARPVRRWQDELELRCWVSELTAEDARLLVACGINDVEELAKADAEALCERINRYRSSQRGGRRPRGRRREYSEPLISGWIGAGRDASSGRSDYGRRRTGAPQRPLSSRAAADDVTADIVRVENRTSSHRSHSARSDRSSHSDGGSQSTRPTGSSRSRRTSNGRNGTSDSEDTHELRFFLSSSDPVGAAPSIGPRTATRLEAVGIHTVADLLSVNPEDAAEKLAYRRINANTMRQWQAQALLACRIPKLRGHDAQILVGCEVTEPSQLAGMDPKELWSRVRPFVKTSEGKRIIRNGKAPDLGEVSDWIEWAHSARSLKAA